MTCFSCRQTLDANARFCTWCGQPQPGPSDPGEPATRTRRRMPADSLSDDRRRRKILETNVMDAVAKGWSIESQGQYHAVIVQGERVNHLLHLILSIITVGLWIIVWLILVISGGQERMMIYVDEQGEVSVTEVKRQ